MKLQNVNKIWQRLEKVTTFTITSSNRSGYGHVAVGRRGDGVVFCEEGEWDVSGERFTNVYCFRRKGGITVSHLRRGEEVFLVELGKEGFHQCGDDRYYGTIDLEGESVVIRWRITGPKKDDFVIIVYN